MPFPCLCYILLDSICWLPSATFRSAVLSNSLCCLKEGPSSSKRSPTNKLSSAATADCHAQVDSKVLFGLELVRCFSLSHGVWLASWFLRGCPFVVWRSSSGSIPSWCNIPGPWLPLPNIILAAYQEDEHHLGLLTLDNSAVLSTTLQSTCSVSSVTLLLNPLCSRPYPFRQSTLPFATRLH